MIARASGSLGRPLASLGDLEDDRETSVVPSGDPRGPLGAKVMKNQWFSIGFERRTRGEPGAGMETRAARMPPGGSQSGPEGVHGKHRKQNWMAFAELHSLCSVLGGQREPKIGGAQKAWYTQHF